jgi:hypothetical protein
MGEALIHDADAVRTPQFLSIAIWRRAVVS